MTKLLGISGSLRSASYNTMLVQAAARAFGPDHFQMGDINLPLFNEDVEAEGIPASVMALCEQIEWADAMIISSPEYNKGPSGAMKNALDWISRVRPMRTIGKPTAVLSAAAGMAGGQRAKSAMYLYLIPFQVKLVLAPEVNVGGAASKFDADGNLTDETTMGFVQQLMDALKAEI